MKSALSECQMHALRLTCVAACCENRQLEAARLLLEEKADVVRTTEKSTVLHTAVSLAAFPQHREFTLEAIKLLAEYKVEIDARVSQGTESRS